MFRSPYRRFAEHDSRDSSIALLVSFPSTQPFHTANEDAVSAPKTLCRLHLTDSRELSLSQGDRAAREGVDAAIALVVFGQPTGDAWLADAEHHLCLDPA